MKKKKIIKPKKRNKKVKAEVGIKAPPSHTHTGTDQKPQPSPYVPKDITQKCSNCGLEEKGGGFQTYLMKFLICGHVICPRCENPDVKCIVCQRNQPVRVKEKQKPIVQPLLPGIMHK
jgi:hypothetical protein